ncbi:MAG: GEVED domain-containing protein [Chitinophagales bacterium]
MRKFSTQILLVAILLWSTTAAFAEKSYRKCASSEVLDRQLKADPAMKGRMDQIEQFTNIFIQNAATHKKANPNGNAVTATVTIPVVFHVVYNTAAQNVSDAMIQNQLAVLNADYGGTNTDIANLPSAFSSIKAGNTGIQFCLAQRDPSGNATTGIVRKSTTTTSFTSDDKVKSSSTGGDNAWDATKYLNIWICNLGGGLLGYAQFPGGAASTDGVVILYSSLPGGSSAPYDKGRTMTHEVGHWLNLRHIWGDASCGNDLVSDTPTQSTSNYGCPAFPHVTCSNGPNGDLFMNYMDYTDDACMYMFSAGQSTRMNALFASGGARVGLVTSQGCVPPSTTCGTPTGLASSSITSSGATVSWTAVSGATSYTLQYKTSAATTWTTVSGITTTSRALTGLAASTTYNYKVSATCSSGTSAYSAASSFTTSGTTSCGVPAGLAASSITSSGATVSWTAVSGATSYTLQYKTSAATTWTTVSGITTTSRALTGLTASTTYNYKVSATCSSGTSAYSTAASFTTTASSTVTYCAANGSNRTYEWIDLIKIGSINRTSAAESGGYVNTGLSTNLVIGSTNDTIRFSAGFASTIYTEYWKIYVDFNKNGVFTDAGELVVSGSTTGSGTYYAVFSVPSTVTAGSTRMRVVMSDASTATSCGTFTYGEVEDYTVNFTTTGKLASYAATENPGVIFNATSGKAAENEPVVAKKNLSVTKETVLTVYPNPVSNAAEIAFNLAAEGNAKIKLVDISGRTIIEKDLGQLYEGDNRYTLDNLNQLESGAYIILLDVNGKTISNKRISLVK